MLESFMGLGAVSNLGALDEGPISQLTIHSLKKDASQFYEKKCDDPIPSYF